METFLASRRAIGPVFITAHIWPVYQSMWNAILFAAFFRNIQTT